MLLLWRGGEWEAEGREGVVRAKEVAQRADLLDDALADRDGLAQPAVELDEVEAHEEMVRGVARRGEALERGLKVAPRLVEARHVA